MWYYLVIEHGYPYFHLTYGLNAEILSLLHQFGLYLYSPYLYKHAVSLQKIRSESVKIQPRLVY